MDRIKKALSKLKKEEKKKLKEILVKIEKGDFKRLDIKKLKGEKGIFRVRKGNFRIIFHKTNTSIKVLTLERRGSKTYRKK